MGAKTKRQRKGEGLKSAHCDIPGFSASVRHLLRSATAKDHAEVNDRFASLIGRGVAGYREFLQLSAAAVGYYVKPMSNGSFPIGKIARARHPSVPTSPNWELPLRPLFGSLHSAAKHINSVSFTCLKVLGLAQRSWSDGCWRAQICKCCMPCAICGMAKACRYGRRSLSA